MSVLELLFLDLLGENRLENQSDRVLESLSCPPTAVDEEKEEEDSKPNPGKPRVRGPALRPPAAPFEAVATPLSTSAGADFGAPFVAGLRPLGVGCGARMPRFRTILNTYQDGRISLLLSGHPFASLIK